MQRKTLLHIVPEGWLILAGLLVALVVFNAWLGVLAGIPAAALIVAATAYFRDAPRDVPAEPLAVIAPVDGVIRHRRECYDPYLDREAIKLSIDVDFFGAYLLRSPVEGTVLELPGETIAELGGTASWIRTDEGDELIMAVRDGALFGQRPCRSNYGERVGQGRCCGNRRLTRRIDLFLPMNSRVEVELGDHVRAGACVLAKLVHKKNGSCNVVCGVHNSTPRPA
ncbi:hypothetical protein [Salinisphaera sp. Q1T1-3]|uniref:hypothetical protein n=1 Tax=Salinisphaera sp. Q1T1-3 TaxID=2321229 RepID=UPI000E75A11D|nr:hypothetical protein [Salinisphaera sp. Q1T1-3]RJS93758.1 hypothetical protein D3260_06740 [Salinisphaera sp. Q1T1-3]